ncbi:type IVB secretion system protein IcmH/DotU [Erwinia sp. SLM-02]|uniref:type IVB secretion system protein IcmH/DotU n=1 Tax=Erwinia sp. SLM-02 TaxID=3020057 RepID=UPI003FCD9EBF
MMPELSPVKENYAALDNPLLAAAFPLLNAVVQIRQAVSHDDPAGLRQQLVDEIRLFENHCRRVEIPFETIIGARYCLCTVLDESAAQTPWGNRGVWSGNGLLVTFHNEAWGGDKFFQLLSRLSQNPDQHLWLLEIINYCLLLGYEGRYRTMENGRGQRDAIRDRLAVLIANVRDTPQHNRLSPPADLPQESAPWRAPVPLWACVSIAAFAACLVFSSLNWRLSNATSTLLQQIWQTPLPETIPGQRGPAPQALTDLRLRLSDLITGHQLDVVDTSSGSRVILPVDGLFNASGTVLSPQGRALIARVATALEAVHGTLLVSVFSDDRPRREERFPSSYEYSQAQASAIASLMQQLIAQPGVSIRTQGRGDSGALMPNDSAQNRAQNRRVEITLFAAPENDDSSNSTGKS